MEDYVSRFQQENTKDWNSFEQCTKDITQLSQFSTNEFMRVDTYVAASLGEKMPPNYMVFFMFVHLKKFEYEYQPMEKVLWEIPFQYENCPFYFTVEKFGFRLMSGAKDLDIVRKLLRKINNSIKIVDRMISPFLKEVVNKGDITFQNQSSFFLERYLYFKSKASELYATKNTEPKNLTEVISYRQHQVKVEREGFFHTQAMLDAYFSYQEHLLILLLPFSGFDKQNENVSKIIADNWSAKFNRVFNPSEDREMMKHYEKLRSIKEKYRNTYAHGGFEKEGGSLYAKVSGLGFIPVRMDVSNDFSLIPIDNMAFSDICSILDEFEEYLFSSEDWSGAIKLIQSGLDIYFDDEHIERYKEVIEDDHVLSQFIEYEVTTLDRENNMDW